MVPQAQKINLGKVDDVRKITKSIPSMVLDIVEHGRPGSQAELIKLYRESQAKADGKWVIVNETTFKYALGRLNPRLDVLKRTGPMLVQRPDLSQCFSQYLGRFACSKEAADLLLETLKRDPTYDAAAANYIVAMDSCEPPSDHRAYRQVVNTARHRSEENSILIRIAVLTFRGRRAGPKDAIRLIEKEKDPLVRNIVLHALFGPEDDAPYKLADCRDLLLREIEWSTRSWHATAGCC